MLSAFGRRSFGSLAQGFPIAAHLHPRVRLLSSSRTNFSTANVAASSNHIKTKWSQRQTAQPESRTWGHISNSSGKSEEELWQQRETTLVRNLPKPHGPYDGRSAWVPKGEVGAAFSKVSRTLRENRVQQELSRARRHERAGDKRIRLASERWRRRFAHEVRMKVKLVQEIRARGA